MTYEEKKAEIERKILIAELFNNSINSFIEKLRHQQKLHKNINESSTISIMGIEGSTDVNASSEEKEGISAFVESTIENYFNQIEAAAAAFTFIPPPPTE